MDIHQKFLLLFTLALSFGCGQAAPNPASTTVSDTIETPISIVCTTNIVQDLVRQVGGDRVTVRAIMNGSAVDPHTYTPSPTDVNLLTAADVVIYSGLHLEGHFDDALESLKHRAIPVICLTRHFESQPDLLIHTENGAADPHVWFDPQLWATCGQSLAEELSKIDPTGADAYVANANAFSTLMDDTKRSGQEILAGIPDDQRILVTAHDAFAYFARAFDFEVEAVQGISTESEPGLKRINELIDLLVLKKISAVFTEQSVSDKNISALLAGCRAKGHDLTIGARLYSDTAGPAGSDEETLRGATIYNLRQIAAALNPAATNQGEGDPGAAK